MNILVLRRDKNWFINTLFNNCFIFYYIEYTPKYTPILHKSKSFPCLAHAMPAFRRCKFCMCKFCTCKIRQVGGLHGIDVSNRAFVGLFCKCGSARRF